MGHRHCSVVQKLPPLNEVLFNFARAITKIVTGPDSVLLEIPAQFLRLNGTDGCNEPPVMLAVHIWLARRGGLIDETRASGGTTHSIVFVELQISEFEDQFL